MNKINLEGLDETVFHEKLENGLNVYVLRKKEFNSFSCYFITNFGALDDTFIPIGEKEIHTFPKGVAHFLEHKLFEQESGPSVMDKFSSLGGICNAFTTYKYTTYYVEGVDNLEDNLLFLIDYVQSPYFTDENVKKEQDIINQERLMTLDNPYRTFHMRILSNLFNSYNYGKSIVGEKEDIYNITKEDLYRCYNTFYNPSNMSLIVVSNENEETVINIVKENQKNKKFDKLNDINIKKVNEEEKVRKKYDIFYDNVTKPEIGYSIKIPISKFNIDKDKAIIYLYIMLLTNFGKISEFNFKLKSDNITDQNIGISVDDYDDYVILNLSCSSSNEEKLIKVIDDKFNNIEISEEKFNLVKKTLISKFVYSFSSVGTIMNYLYNNYYDNKTITSDTFTKYKQLNYEEYNRLIKDTMFNNKSITIMKPLKDKE